MSTNLVIVAIPAEDQRVHKISTEKVPHLTLLFLGDAENNPNVNRIFQFVWHAVNVAEHGPFMLNKDYRSILGEDKADVIHFEKDWSFKWVNGFRNQLLKNSDIRTAYESVEQFPEWRPHLTLGYPEAPANEVENEYDLDWVTFDRIAVWTGDYEGPEFRLRWPEREHGDDMSVAWGGMTDERVEEFLEHYGVKGMKWGIRKDTSSAGGAIRTKAHREKAKRLRNEADALDKASEKSKGAIRKRALKEKAERNRRHADALEKKFGSDAPAVGGVKSTIKRGAAAVGRGLNKFGEALGEHFYESSIYSQTNHEAIHNQVADEIDSKIYRLQTAPKYRGKNLKTDQKLKTEYEQDVSKVTDAAYRRAVKDHIGENAKGTKEARYVDDARGARIEIRDKKSGEIVRESSLRSVQEINADRLDTTLSGRRTKHAADDDDAAPDITIPLKLDANGQIKAVGRVRTETAEHGETFIEGLMHGDLVLEHYGTKGMRWGVRNDPATARGAAVVEGLRSKKAPPAPVAPQANSKVPHGDRRKTKIETEGGENHPASEDAIKVAKARVKLKKSGPATLTNQELREVAERMRLEQQVVEMNRGGANKFIRKLFKDQGSQAVNEVVREGVKESRTQVKDRVKNRG